MMLSTMYLAFLASLSDLNFVAQRYSDLHLLKLADV